MDNRLSDDTLEKVSGGDGIFQNSKKPRIMSQGDGGCGPFREKNGDLLSYHPKK